MAKYFIIFFIKLLFCYASCKTSDRSFVIDYNNNCFLKDNEPFRYISGGMHYFRIPSVYWRDRLMKAKAIGVNTIQTYIAWNVHETNHGIYDFSGDNDLLNFIEIAEELGLLVILRPGPYIDAEWEFGGFPWWLAKNQSLSMRTSDPVFMQYVERWFNKLLPMLKPKLYKNGGPVIAVQVENEYGGYYACDKKYLQLLKNIYDKNFGEDSVVLFTVDGYKDEELQCGTIPEVYKTVDFGSETSPEEAFQQQRKYQTSGPLVNSEYYTGWLDYWGQPHQTRDSKKIAEQLDNILRLNASVNLYMLHGGTNFGFMNGIDYNPDPLVLLICPTSYDYDAPISEAGDTTAKYFQIREILKKYVKHPLSPVPQNTTKTSELLVPTYPFLNVTSFIERMYNYNVKPVQNKFPLSMEAINQGYGLVLYRTKVPTQFQNVTVHLTIEKVADRSMIITDGRLVRIFESGGRIDSSVVLGKELNILVENQGRAADSVNNVNYLPQPKGILGNVLITEKQIPLTDWSMFSINDSMLEPMHLNLPREKINIEQLSITANESGYIIEYFGMFVVGYPTDSFLRLDDFDKGQVLINGFNVGRFWQSQGPQKTLFVPKSFFVAGINALEIISLSKLKFQIRNVTFMEEPILG